MSGNGNTLSYSDPRQGPARHLLAPCLIVTLEAARPTAAPARLSLNEVDEVRIGRGGERGYRRFTDGGVATLRVDIADDWMSSDHARLRRAVGGWVLQDAGSKNGTFVDGVRRTEVRLEDGDLIETGGTLMIFRSGLPLRYDEPPDRVGRDEPLATLVPTLAEDFEALRRVARSDLSILLTGETGTGKEVTARAIHDLSGRRGAFVAVNCGALPDNLIESELFGHRKGAFSGATDDRPGLIRASHGGTLLLDEIAELPEASQAVLLRVLQEREVVPVGDTRPHPVDLRVIAATHQNLAAAVDAGRFRTDLYARLVGFQMRLPALRERREDLALLLRSLLPRLAGERADRIVLTRDAARALCRYDWPLNIRELEQSLSAALALTPGDEIGLEQLPAAVRRGPMAAGADPNDPDAELRARLDAALRTHDGNLSAVARDLGKARMQIRRWCKRLGIDPDRYRRG